MPMHNNLIYMLMVEKFPGWISKKGNMFFSKEQTRLTS